MTNIYSQLLVLKEKTLFNKQFSLKSYVRNWSFEIKVIDIF